MAFDGDDNDDNDDVYTQIIIEGVKKSAPYVSI
jgi:hypothetical protein